MNYYQHITEGLKAWGLEYDDPKIWIFYHLISLMGEEHFNRSFEYYFMGDLEFDEGFHGFHKSMRQLDFYDIGEGHLDMLFWEFNHLTDLPYNALKTFTEKLQVGMVDVLDNDLDQTKGWDKFGFFNTSRK